MILKRKITPYFKLLAAVFVGFLMVCILFVSSIYLGLWGKLPSQSDLTDLQYQRASEVYTADSVLIGKYYLFDRQPITYDDFPSHLIEALIAIEDERFYKHSGIDVTSLFRVGLKTVLMGDASSGGGSTLTQQLAKNLYPRKERKSATLVVDKIKEMIIARRLEKSHTKEEILTRYLNTVSFGDNTFGVESAALKFFNTQAKALRIEEAATLVGMLKATYNYNPRIFPEAGKTRRNIVMQSMYTNNFLQADQKDSLVQLPLVLSYTSLDHNEGIAPYFREEVRKQLVQWVSEQNSQGQSYNLYTSGLKIYTTLNYKMQVMAEESMVAHMRSLQRDFEKSYGKNAPWLSNKTFINKMIQQSLPYKKLKQAGLSESEILAALHKKREMILSDWQGDTVIHASTIDSLQHYAKRLHTGSMAIDPSTGAVKSWIGGIDFKHFKYDHVSQSKRQVGSTFKPIVYTAALENDIAPCTYFSAQKVAYEDLEGWTPTNSGNTDEAYLNYSMKEALSKSVNTVTVKVLETTGIPKVLAQAKKMGIVSDLPKVPSLALGTAALKISELAGAYASYVNQGKSVKPFLIQKISSHTDSILAVFSPEISDRNAFSETTRQLMLEMMKETVNGGTASRIRSVYQLKNDIAGKTGTTQNNKDAWFVALTPKLVHVTWVGLDHHEIGFNSTKLGQGANAALPMFALWMQKLNKDDSFSEITKSKFETPSASILQQLDCEPVKRDGFFKRLFKNPKKVKSKKFEDKV
ncbi:transglycosylase domain-containing protein [Arenibacter sp. GZD96]|uniref:transglycosylase domain-containing protein n=1 Tax=Aurantibrevibacter litoralis TaxID=3106030 RepID=UPI002AFE86F6|nr:transglycosylase domain-containing protein [Arenibacter sp. GZD-96]MEA1787537.1 transglycosylase domain-containing protein [Arenibacter sp. GZD-96]